MSYAFEIAETGFDPAQVSDGYSRDITHNIFDSPLRFAYLAAPGTLEPNTAAAMPEMSADFKTFTVRLRPGIFFTPDPVFGGRPRELVAADYVYSLKRIADPRWKSPSWGGLESDGIVGLKDLHEEALRSGRFDYDREIPGLRALDRYTLRITLDKGNPRLADSVLADASIYGAVAREVVERYGDRMMEHPVGTGPFKLGEWRRSSRIVLERNPDYREDIYRAPRSSGDADARALAARLDGRRLPMLDRVEIAIIEESQPRWLSFLNGEFDFLERMPRDLVPIALPGNRPSPALQRKHVQVYRSPEIDVTTLVYNMDDPVVGGLAPAQVALRRALNLGLDADEVVRSLYKYQAFPAQSVVMPDTYGYDATLHTENGDHDPARANALLDLYGYARGSDGFRTRPDGSALRIVIRTEPDQRSRLYDEIVKKSFDALGVQVDFQVAKWPENLKNVQNGHFTVWFVSYLSTVPDCDDALRFGYGPAVGGTNLSRFALPAYDRLYREVSQLADGDERLAKIREMVGLLVVYAPLKAIAHRYKTDMAYPWVIGYRKWPFVHDWWRYVDVDTQAQAAGRH